MYAFREKYAKEWGLNLIVRPCPPVEEVDATLPPAARSAARKTLGLKNTLREFGFQGIIAGIRRDEESIRAKERVFSPRGEDGGWNPKDQPPEFWHQFNTDVPAGAHLRVHPLLHWTELDIWRYVQREKIPCVDLYFAKHGKRYRSLGDSDITFPMPSGASSIDEVIAELEATRVPERAGRAMDHEAEDAFERLRADGYM
jgi:sulfate adenylyltransferase subunit 2